MPKIIVARCNASFCMRYTTPDNDFCRRGFKATGDYVRSIRKLSDGYDQALQDFKESSHTIHETKQRMESWVVWSVGNCSIHSFDGLHYNEFNSTSS